MSEHKIPIPSMLYNAAVGGHVTNSQQIIDENLNREQNDINQETVGAVPYNSTTPNGMGRIVLKKTDNVKEIVEAQTNGNTIFIPFAGMYVDQYMGRNSWFRNWSSSLDSSDDPEVASNFYNNCSNFSHIHAWNRCAGFSVRGVKDK